MMMFAVVFGLSMDYEVFLLSRIREEYLHSGDPTGSVADGLAATARVITAAAAIMVVVFGAFLFEDARVIKLFGVGLGFAVLVDASIVRMLLVPATMELLGKRNWWMPGWPAIPVRLSAANPASLTTNSDADRPQGRNRRVTNRGCSNMNWRERPAPTRSPIDIRPVISATPVMPSQMGRSMPRRRWLSIHRPVCAASMQI